MRGAPPVQVACGQDARWHWFIRGLHGLAAASLAWWLATLSGLRLPLLGVVIGLAAMLALLMPPAKPQSGAAPSLTWDGQQWLWQGEPADVAVMVDLDRWLLLRVATGLGGHWVPLSFAAGDPVGPLFRAALQAHAGRARHGDD